MGGFNRTMNSDNILPGNNKNQYGFGAATRADTEKVYQGAGLTALQQNDRPDPFSYNISKSLKATSPVNPAFTLGIRRDHEGIFPRTETHPDPGSYDLSNSFEATKQQSPSYTLGVRHPIDNISNNPGPGNYHNATMPKISTNPRCSSPKFGSSTRDDHKQLYFGADLSSKDPEKLNESNPGYVYSTSESTLNSYLYSGPSFSILLPRKEPKLEDKVVQEEQPDVVYDREFDWLYPERVTERKKLKDPFIQNITNKGDINTSRRFPAYSFSTGTREIKNPLGLQSPGPVYLLPSLVGKDGPKQSFPRSERDSCFKDEDRNCKNKTKKKNISAGTGIDPKEKGLTLCNKLPQSEVFFRALDPDGELE